MATDPDGDVPELDDPVVVPGSGPARGRDGVEHDDHGPELDLDRIAAPAEEPALEIDGGEPAVAPNPATAVDPGEEAAPGTRGPIAQATESLRADSGRLLRTGLKAAAWLGIAGLLLGETGVLAAVVGGALAGDVVVWFVIRGFELPRHLWTFQLEALVNIGAVWAMVDVMHLFDSFREPDLLPFGLVAFMLVGVGRFAVWWLPRAIEG